MEKEIKPEKMAVPNSRVKQLIFGVFWLAAAGGLIALFVCAYLITRETDPMPKNLIVMLIVASVLFCPPMIALGVSHLYKLKFDYIFFADEKGFTDHYSILPLGFIGWEDVNEISYQRLDLLGDPPLPCIRISVNRTALKRRMRGLAKLKTLKIWSGSPLRFHFFAAKAKRKEIYPPLKTLYDIYKADHSIQKNEQ